MNVVLAHGGLEGGIHLLHVQTTVRHLGVAGRARGPGLLAVLRVAGQATNAFVHADSGTVITTAHLHGGDWRVALVAQGLTPVLAHLDRARAFQIGTGTKQQAVTFDPPGGTDPLAQSGPTPMTPVRCP